MFRTLVVALLFVLGCTSEKELELRDIIRAELARLPRENRTVYYVICVDDLDIDSTTDSTAHAKAKLRYVSTPLLDESGDVIPSAKVVETSTFEGEFRLEDGTWKLRSHMLTPIHYSRAPPDLVVFAEDRTTVRIGNRRVRARSGELAAAMREASAAWRELGVDKRAIPIVIRGRAGLPGLRQMIVELGYRSISER